MADSNDNTVAEFNIESFRSFYEDNREIMETLDNVCSYVDDIIANVSSVKLTVDDINAQLDGLKTTVAPTIPSPDLLYTCVNNLASIMQEDTTKIVGGLLYYEEQARLYNEGKINELVPLSDIINNASTYNLFWIANAFLSTSKFKAASFIAAYGTDLEYNDATFVMGDAVSGIFKKWVSAVTKNSPKFRVWANASIGTAAVIIGTGLIDYFGDYGEFTPEDKKRTLLDMGVSGLSYLEWSLVAGFVGGPAGVVAAAVIGIPTSIVLNWFKDYLTGDYVVDTFDVENEDGTKTTYKVEHNGHGNNGTFDAYVDMLERNRETYYINDVKVSEHVYKNKMYTDWYSFIEEDEPGMSSCYATNSAASKFSEYLDILAQADSYEDGRKEFWSSMMSDPNYEVYRSIYERLICDYGFDLEEFYNYRNMKGE